jgi:phage virion morphogenesis protein
MVGVAIQTSLDAVSAIKTLSRLSSTELDLISYEVGSLIEDQTKRRIADEKTAPDGTPWAPWSARYAESLKRPNRVSPRSLLVGDGNLLESIQNYTAGEQIEVGTPLIYGAVHQFGYKGIPARPYLGLSSENSREIEDLVMERLQELLQ